MLHHTGGKMPDSFANVKSITACVIKPLTFSNICKILNIVASCVMQIILMFLVTSQLVFNLT